MLPERCWVGYRRETGILNAYLARNPEPEHLIGCKECDMRSKTDIPIRQIMTCQQMLCSFASGPCSRDGLRKKKRKNLEVARNILRRRDNCSLACHPSSLHPFSPPHASSRSFPRTFSFVFCLRHMLGLSIFAPHRASPSFSVTYVTPSGSAFLFLKKKNSGAEK